MSHFRWFSLLTTTVFLVGCTKFIQDWIDGTVVIPETYSYCGSSPADGGCCTVKQPNSSTSHQCVASVSDCLSMGGTGIQTIFPSKPGNGFCEATPKPVKILADLPQSTYTELFLPTSHNCASECAISPKPAYCSSFDISHKALTTTISMLERVFDPNTTSLPATDYMTAYGVTLDPCGRGDISVSASEISNSASIAKACNIVTDINLESFGFSNVHADITVPPKIKGAKISISGEQKIEFEIDAAPLIVFDYNSSGYGSGRLNSLGYSGDTLWVGVGPRCISFSNSKK